MADCLGVTRTGKKCTGTVVPPRSYCWWHDPANEEARKQAAAKGGRSKLTNKIAPLWGELRDLIVKIEDGSLEPARANAILRVYNTLIACKRLELDVEQRLEILPRLEELEARAARNRGRA